MILLPWLPLVQPMTTLALDFLGPYNNDKFQIRNRSTGKCLKSMQANQWNSYRAVVINCNDESSKAWTFSTN